MTERIQDSRPIKLSRADMARNPAIIRKAQQYRLRRVAEPKTPWVGFKTPLQYSLALLKTGQTNEEGPNFQELKKASETLEDLKREFTNCKESVKTL